MKNLHLSLETKWFNMTDPEFKTEDYRKITPYWIKRLCKPLPNNMVIAYLSQEAMIKGIKERGFKDFATNVMTLGYPSREDKSRRKVYEHAGIEIRTGVEEWGAEPNKLYFVIKHGEKIE